MVKIAFICPTHRESELHAYTASALRTFFDTTANGVGIVVDDASEGWESAHTSHLKGLAAHEGQECVVFRYADWGGLTRSWNKGLSIAKDMGCDYAICGNNDVLFPPMWYQGLLHAMESGYSLVGPLSNAPGVTAKKKQEVQRYFPDYKPSDDLAYINMVQKFLLDKFLGDVIDAPVNGFFQMAKMTTWLRGSYSRNFVYRPRNERTSKGYRNPTPLMTLNEDELQGRWRELGFKSGVVPSSFIFHYRAVTRGGRYKKGLWTRKSED